MDDLVPLCVQLPRVLGHHPFLLLQEGQPQGLLLHLHHVRRGHLPHHLADGKHEDEHRLRPWPVCHLRHDTLSDRDHQNPRNDLSLRGDGPEHRERHGTLDELPRTDFGESAYLVDCLDFGRHKDAEAHRDEDCALRPHRKHKARQGRRPESRPCRAHGLGNQQGGSRAYRLPARRGLCEGVLQAHRWRSEHD